MRRFLNRAVMMEYVIIAVMVAAAVVVAVIMLGRTVNQEFQVATEAMVDQKNAQTDQKAVRSDAKNKKTKAESHANTMHGSGIN